MVAGHAVLSVVADIAELQRISVDAEHRRAGLATALLDAVVATARAGGADRLLLEVREDNAGALSFYAARDFVEVDRRPRYYRDGTTAVVLRRGLGPACCGLESTRAEGVRGAVAELLVDVDRGRVVGVDAEAGGARAPGERATGQGGRDQPAESAALVGRAAR